MDMRRGALTLAIAFGAFACAPGADEPADEVDMDAADEVASAPTSQEFAEFRGEVIETFGEIRAELAAMRDSVRVEGAEAWEDLSGSAEEASSEVMADLDRLAEATADEARQIQLSASERLATLEGEVARRDVENSPDPAALIEAMNERLAELEADLDAVWQETEVVDTVPPGPETSTDQSVVSEQEIMDLRTRLIELRADLERVGTATADEFDAARQDLGEEVAELTRDGRLEWYEARWGLEDPA
jgi:hypothetical protein